MCLCPPLHPLPIHSLPCPPNPPTPVPAPRLYHFVQVSKSSATIRFPSIWIRSHLIFYMENEEKGTLFPPPTRISISSERSLSHRTREINKLKDSVSFQESKGGRFTMSLFSSLKARCSGSNRLSWQAQKELLCLHAHPKNSSKMLCSSQGGDIPAGHSQVENSRVTPMHHRSATQHTAACS